MQRIPTPQAAGRKVYVEGSHPGTRVPAREIALEPPHTPVRLYDTSGPYTDPEAEIELLTKHRIGWIVSKDSGGRASAKIEAARRLGLPVVLVERPAPPPGPMVETVDAVIDWINDTLF